MATTLGTVVGLGSTSLSSSSSGLTSGFVRSPVSARNPLRQACPSVRGGKVTCFERDWLRTDYSVIGFGLIGWIAPSSIPAINGQSLTGLFFESIGAELAHFPTPPPLTSQFCLTCKAGYIVVACVMSRLWLITWHLGLFLCLTFGQIGFKGTTEDYF